MTLIWAYKTIREMLLARRYCPREVPPVDAQGVYALFLNDQAALKQLTVGPSGLLYVGMTESSLKVRNHFNQPNSGFSSPRRSLGAMLREELKLRAVPRAPGSSPTNTRNFRFSDAGERRLTLWMEHHLTYGFTRAEHEVPGMEDRLIKELKPPLNVIGWRKPQAAQVCACAAPRMLRGSP